MIALYLRVSTEKQGDKWSLPEQERLGKAWCDGKEHAIYKESESGADFNRPELQRMLGLAPPFRVLCSSDARLEQQLFKKMP
jgi:DNA invertase Pin-like site-specific DNA recombinase